MTLRDVMEVAVIKLGLEKDVELDDVNACGETAKRLMLAINNTVTELATCYLPLYTKENIIVKDGILRYDTLKRRIIKTLSIKKKGIPIKFKAYPSHVDLEDGEYEIEYTYLPSEASLCDTLECDVRVNKDIIALGAISEYSLMVGEYEKGSIYDEKYKEALKNISVNAREIRIKRRVWL